MYVHVRQSGQSSNLSSFLFLQKSKDHVTIVEVSGTGDSITIQDGYRTKLEWVYEVSANVSLICSNA